MISFLICTHNRHELVQQAIKSIIENITDIEYEIIIQNDVKDNLKKKLEYLLDDRIHYFNKSTKNLTENYKFLVQQSKYKYIYFLEDDDILLNNFSISKIIESNMDYYMCLYKYNTSRENLNIIEFRNYFNILKPIEFSKDIFNIYPTPESFKPFQLGQMIIKKEVLKNWNFENPNNKYNDWYLIYNNPGTFKYYNIFLYSQGYPEITIS